LIVNEKRSSQNSSITADACLTWQRKLTGKYRLPICCAEPVPVTVNKTSNAEGSPSQRLLTLLVSDDVPGKVNRVLEKHP
jgi:hypothetical protein